MNKSDLTPTEMERVRAISVRCGKPEFAGDYEDEVFLPKDFIGKNMYILRAEGRSMEPTIPDGSLLLMEVSADYDHGALLVLRTSDGLMVKRYDAVHHKLKSDNPLYPDLEFSGFDEVTVIGIVRKMIIDF